MLAPSGQIVHNAIGSTELRVFSNFYENIGKTRIGTPFGARYGPGMQRTVRVWDLPTRLFHWALVLCVIGLVVTGNIGGSAMVWHFRFGYCVLTLWLFRICWGFVGGHWSRFSNFFYSPVTIIAYLKGVRRRGDSVGHNPLGSLSVFGMLGILALQVGTGLFSDDEIATAGPLTRFVSGAWVSIATSYHKGLGKTIVLVLVALHIAAIVFYRVGKGENLVRPMIVGDKAVDDDVPSARDGVGQHLLALVLLLGCALLVNWVAGLGN